MHLALALVLFGPFDVQAVHPRRFRVELGLAGQTPSSANRGLDLPPERGTGFHVSLGLRLSPALSVHLLGRGARFGFSGPYAAWAGGSELDLGASVRFTRPLWRRARLGAELGVLHGWVWVGIAGRRRPPVAGTGGIARGFMELGLSSRAALVVGVSGTRVELVAGGIGWLGVDTSLALDF